MRFFASKAERVEGFRKGRAPQTDPAYVAALGMADDTQASEVALAVRRAVAKIGDVDPLYVYADDGMQELSLLPVWDSMDWVALIMELEDQIDIRISDNDAEKLTPVRYEDEFSVPDFTHRVLRFLRDEPLGR